VIAPIRAFPAEFGLHLRRTCTAIGKSWTVWLRALRRLSKFRRGPAVEHSKIKVFVSHVLEGWDALVQGGWRGPALGAVFNIGFDMLTLNFLFWAAGYRMSAVLLLAGYGVPQLLGKATLILGGAGLG
jgi:uncharacterized membrane protein YbhN (UPF0104 family)